MVFTTERIFRSRVGFQLKTTEFRSEALTD